VLQNDLASAPVWVAGDLYIGGHGLALGYWRDEVKTASSFLTHPQSGERLYRTGDRGRLLPDGNIEFLGRQDHQIKLQGHRIELGEIESALTRQPAVANAVAMVREDRKGDRRLVAYIVGEDLDTAVLTQALQQCLPHYMVPSAWVMLEKLPLTQNGKVDRKALPAPDAGATEANFIAPQTATEQRMVEIWSRLLQLPVERISTTSDFFALGGQSLLAIRLVAEIAEAFGIQIEMRKLFAQPSISQIAALIDSATELESIARRFASMPEPYVTEIEI
jgi:acyl carrier protein